MLIGAGHQVTILKAAGKYWPRVDEVAGADLVVNHAMQVHPDLLNRVASKLPETTFVNCNHSAIGHLERAGNWAADRFTAAIHAARNFRNVWYASQDGIAEQVGKAAGIERAIWLPVPGHILDPRTYRPPAEPACVVIAGRPDPIKNILMQFIALGLMRDRVRLSLCVNPTPQILNALKALDLPCDFRGCMPHPKWLNFLRTTADVVLTVSLAESYGFVAAEAAQLGVPIVASDVIRFADPFMVVPTGDPVAIADKLDFVLYEHEHAANRAAKFARASAELQLSGYLRRIEWLAGPKTSQY